MPSLVSNSGKSIVVKIGHESIFNSPPIVSSLLDDTFVNFVFDDTSKLLETCVNFGKESEVNCVRFAGPLATDFDITGNRDEIGSAERCQRALTVDNKIPIDGLHAG